jgi:urease accessory protein
VDLLALLQLASPALPVGGFAYSQGLETAIAEGIVTDAASAGRWIEEALTLSLARLEAPLWLRAYDAAAAHDDAELARWAAEALAVRETAELRAESVQMGSSLLRVLPALALPAPPMALPYSSAFAWACAAAGIERATGLGAYLWTWAENQVLVAVKSVPLGQQAGQTLLARLRPAIATAVATAARLGDDEIGSCALGLALASARHEIQYTRLYRS